MKKRTPVSDIMSKTLITVNHTNTLRDVAQFIEEKKIHHLPVVSGNKIIGMISKSDMERITFVNDFQGETVSTQLYDALTIEQVMTKNLVLIQKHQTIHEAAVILSENEFHALPVIDGDAIVGIVTSVDILKYFIDQY